MKKLFFSAFLILAAVLTVFAVSCVHSSRPDDSTATTPEAVTTAIDETPPVLTGWFDYGSALYERDKFEPGAMTSIEIQMAKNEIEGFQYLVTSDRDTDGIRCDVTPLNDGNGHTLSGTVNVVWYTWINQSDNRHSVFVWEPVAMLPMDDEYQGGSFDIASNTCRTLYVQFKTDINTVPGTYTGRLSVSKNGRELLSGDVSVRVRDIYYDEKTECLTMMGLGYDKEDTNQLMPKGPDSAPALGRQQASGRFANQELLLEYTDFLLENRFCTTWLPFEWGILDTDIELVRKYMDNPRFTSVNISERGAALSKIYKLFSENGWTDKCYFAAFDEPTKEEHLQYIMGNAREVNRFFPTTHFLDAFGVNISLDGKNVVERMAEYTTAYCPNTIAFNGEIKDSMLKYKAERGDTLIWYVCGGQSNGYINALPCTPGTDKRLLFWQQYQQNVDGFLYWRVSLWNICYDIWADDYMETDFPFPKGSEFPTDDGVLIYWHPITKKPVTTLGFEAMRDGVEDFQLFRMAEAKFGREEVLRYVEQITTDVTEFVKYQDGSTELLNNIKNQVFDLLENAG